MFNCSQTSYDSKEDKRIQRRVSKRTPSKYFTPKFFWFLTQSKTKILFEPEELVKSYSDVINFVCHSFEYAKYSSIGSNTDYRNITCIGTSLIPLICIEKYPSVYQRLTAKRQRDLRFQYEINQIKVRLFENSNKDNEVPTIFFVGNCLQISLYLHPDEFEEYWQLKTCNQLLLNVELKLPLYNESDMSVFENRAYVDALGIIDDNNILEKYSDNKYGYQARLNIDSSSITIGYQVFHKPNHLFQMLKEIHTSKHQCRGY